MHFLSDLLRGTPEHFRLNNARNGRTIATRVMTAFDSATRRKGLLGRNSMPESSALILAPTNAVHTFFMRFPIDVAFVTKTGHVLNVRHGLRPWRVAGALRAYAVIELPAGALTGSDTKRGDVVTLVATV